MVPRFVLLFLAYALLAGAPALAADPFPIPAAAFVVKSGDTLVWSHQAERRLPPASLTKIMTALVVMEHARLGEVVTVSASAAAEGGSRLRLIEGEKLSVMDLLTATLVRSANDAAHALAQHVAGSHENFVVLMNSKSEELGLADTRFQNAIGWDHARHYSTAADMARLAEIALLDPTIRHLVSLEEVRIQTVGGGRIWDLKNSNKLLGLYDGLTGVKTGYTSKAGPCLIAMAERGGERVLVVLFNSPKRWEATPAIMNKAFEQIVLTNGTTRVAFLDTSESGAEEAATGQSIGN